MREEWKQFCLEIDRATTGTPDTEKLLQIFSWNGDWVRFKELMDNYLHDVSGDSLEDGLDEIVDELDDVMRHVHKLKDRIK